MPATLCPHCQAVLPDRGRQPATCPKCNRSVPPRSSAAAGPAVPAGSSRRLALLGVLGVIVIGLVVGLVWFRGDLEGLRVLSQPRPEVLGKMPQEEEDEPESNEKPNPLPPPRVAE